MSATKPRKVGDEVWLAPGSGFVGESNLFKVRLLGPPWNEMLDDGRPSSCMLCDSDKDCCEWDNVEIVQAPAGRESAIGKHMCHVSECEMFDEPQTERGIAG